MNFIYQQRAKISKILVIGCFYSHAVFSSSLSDSLNTMIQKELPHASVSVLIKEVGKKDCLYSFEAEKLLTPASSVKLFTAAAAIYKLGKAYQYKTEILASNDSIYIRFSGDPSLTSKDLKKLVSQLKEEGYNTINGNVVIDASRYKPPYYANGVSRDDIGWYYEAPSSAVILDQNKATFNIISAKQLGKKVIITKTDEKPPITLVNDVVSVSRKQKKYHCNFNIEVMPKNVLRLYGCLQQYKDPRRLSFAVTDPVYYAQQVIKNALIDSGIVLKGKVVKGATPRDAKKLVEHQSPKLAELVTYMLKESDNLYADSLTKLLGYALTQQGTYKQGVYAIIRVLAAHTDINSKQVDLADGQGTRYNLTSAKQLVVLLEDMYANNSMRSFMLEALPVMGESGSLKYRMKEAKISAKVHAKTGTMHDISSLSGYMIPKSGQPVVFSMIFNGVHPNVGKAKALEEKILLTIENNLIKKK